MSFFNILKDKYHIDLNAQQKQAVSHFRGPALVLAGPGSGKTTVITARTAYLVLEMGVKPDNILTMTFNRAAKLEMEHRFSRIYGTEMGSKIHFSTLHSFCNLIVRDYERRRGKWLKRIEGEDAEEENKRFIIKSICQEVNGTRINDDDLENLINQIGLVKNRMLKEFDDIETGIKNFQAVYKAYEEYKKANLFMDFDDMLTYAYSILLKCPEILKRYRNMYRFIQVDEGQDLSKLQFEIIKLLVDAKDSNLFIVADDDQSIYGFRGAEPQYIIDIKEQFKGCMVYLLEHNYRSTRNIVDISSSFIKQNSNRFDKNHNTHNDFKEDPYIVQVKDNTEQLKFIAEKLKEHHKQGKNTSVLYRNNLSSITIADYLERKEISFRVKQNKLFFFNHWVVQDIKAFLRFSLNQCDSEAFERIYYKMNRYISKNMLENALSCQNKESIIDGILQRCEMKPFQIKNLKELKKEFKKLAGKHPSVALKYIEENFKYCDYVKEYCDNTGLAYDYSCSLFEILKTVAEGTGTVPAFLKRMEELLEMFEKPRKMVSGNAVTLTTMHSSKGLEFDAVLMVDLTEAETPGLKALQLLQKEKDASLMEEERRLFYVGMTRAKERLYLISSTSQNGAAKPRSTFVNEVNACMNKKYTDEIGEGMVIYHKHFGQGIIASVLEQKDGRTIIEIDFHGIRRKLDFSLCMDNELLSY